MTAESLAAGPPDAPAIVFIHGTRLCRAIWAPQVAALGGEFRAIAIDLPAHGQRAGEPFSLESAADAVAATIRAEAAGGSAIVVGLSLGGYVAMDWLPASRTSSAASSSAAPPRNRRG